MPHPSRGAALIIGMLILLMLTVLGIASVQVTLMEEKMAGNYRDAALAFHAAESALRDAEADIRGRVDGLKGFDTSCSIGLVDASSGLSSDITIDFPPPDPPDDDSHPEGPNGVRFGYYTGATALTGVACQPRYWIEGFRVWPAGAAGWKTRYRITAVACGGNATTQAMLQSVYAQF